MPFTIPPPPEPEHFLTLNEIVDLMRGIVKRVNTDLDTPEQLPDRSLIPVLTTYVGIGPQPALGFGNSVSGTISSVGPEHPGSPAWRACDGNLFTGAFNSAGVMFQFVRPVTVSSWAYEFQTSQAPYLQGSYDGIVYTTVDTALTSVAAQINTRTIAPTNFTFWRIRCPAYNEHILYFQLFI